MNGTNDLTVYAYKNYGFLVMGETTIGVIYVGPPKRGSSANIPAELRKLLGRDHVTSYVIPLPMALYNLWDALYRAKRSIVAGVVLTYNDADVINEFTDYMSMVARVLTNKGKIKQVIVNTPIKLLMRDSTPLFRLKAPESAGLPYDRGYLRFSDIASIMHREYGTPIIEET